MRGQLQNGSRTSFPSIVVPADQRCGERYEHFYQEEKTVTIVHQCAHHRIHLVRVAVGNQINRAYGIQSRHDIYSYDYGNQRRILPEGCSESPRGSEILYYCCGHECQKYPANRRHCSRAPLSVTNARNGYKSDQLTTRKASLDQIQSAALVVN